ncbi:MAG: aldose epimerase family protein [Bacilli bacterium]|jgi:aldose 1-epimerase|nr:galactose mutarotase [Bacilli bacterium]MDD3388743.1 galactose mutarotase [Bacilli bacterium]MDD4344533.1 galactose mutarotase [Bacilli bacterium]MDD4520427.1 galactose mutarotase [Bacilli bacterium]MDY0399158.1 aldose epimerase family protein [Bacilli bacterium]
MSELIKVKNRLGMEVTFSPIGASIFDIKIPTKNGNISVTVHPQNVAEFNVSTGHFGKTIGRNAGRIRHGKFVINKQEYQIGAGESAGLHGGNDGLSFKEFNFAQHTNMFATIIIFSYLSPHLESGFPGNAHIQVTYQIPHLINRIDIVYHAFSNQDTIMNLSNHVYWNLNGDDDILNHLLGIKALKFAEVDECLCPKSICPVSQVMDFRQLHKVGDYIKNPYLTPTDGYNHPYILNPDEKEVRPVAQLIGDKSHITMTLYSDYPILIFYSGNVASLDITNHHTPFLKHQGLALECQYLPNAMNNAFDQEKTGILPAETNYHQQITYLFSSLE